MFLHLTGYSLVNSRGQLDNCLSIYGPAGQLCLFPDSCGISSIRQTVRPIYVFICTARLRLRLLFYFSLSKSINSFCFCNSIFIYLTPASFTSLDPFLATAPSSLVSFLSLLSLAPCSTSTLYDPSHVSVSVCTE